MRRGLLTPRQRIGRRTLGAISPQTLLRTEQVTMTGIPVTSKHEKRSRNHLFAVTGGPFLRRELHQRSNWVSCTSSREPVDFNSRKSGGQGLISSRTSGFDYWSSSDFVARLERKLLSALVVKSRERHPRGSLTKLLGRCEKHRGGRFVTAPWESPSSRLCVRLDQ